MRKMFVHIGVDKTGTTYLQRSFERHSDWLASQNILYPCNEERAYYNEQHVPLACYLMGEFRGWMKRSKMPSEETWKQFQEDIEMYPSHSVLISSEAFGSVDTKPESIKRTAELLKGYDVKIIVYLRPQFEYAISTIQQRIKFGHPNPSPEFWSTGKAPMLNYAARLEPFFQAFGKENVIIKKYDRRLFKNGNIFQDFLSVLSLNFDGKLENSIENESFSLEEMEVLKSVNRYLTSIYSSSDARYEDNQVRLVIRNWLGRMPKNSTPIIHGVDPGLQTKTIENYSKMNIGLFGEDFDHSLQDEYELKAVDVEEVLAKLIVLIARQLVKERKEQPKNAALSE